MNPFLETLLLCLLVSIMPLLIHLGALRGAKFYPKRIAKDPCTNAFVFRWIWPVIFMNGLLVAITVALFYLVDGYLWTIPLIISFPTLIFQTAFLTITKYRDTLGR